MKKGSYEIIAMITVVLILVFGIGMALGFSLGAQFPKTAWADFAGVVAQVFAVFGTIVGAYFLATMQRRAEFRDNIVKVHILTRDICETLKLCCKACSSAEPKLKFLLLGGRRNIIQLEQMPVEKMPVECLHSISQLIEIAHEQFDFFEKSKDEIASGARLFFNPKFLNEQKNTIMAIEDSIYLDLQRAYPSIQKNFINKHL